MIELSDLTQRIERILLTWGTVSIIAGLVLISSSPGTLFAGIGIQAIIWGIIDAVIVIFVIRKRKDESREKIAREVYINIYLDILYQVVGVIVIISLLQDPYMVGNGIGVIIQGFFLLILDLYYYTSLNKLGTETTSN